ncbi:MAG TPA: YcaO-like family protein [Bryobacteraceae bacterium]|nr:YcaO-like family protein [Bryobacteraceae bacterium]
MRAKIDVTFRQSIEPHLIIADQKTEQGPGALWFSVGNLKIQSLRQVPVSGAGVTKDLAITALVFEGIERRNLFLSSHRGTGRLTTAPSGDLAVEAISLVTGREKLVPVGEVFLDAVTEGFALRSPNSSGCAAGINAEHALQGALFEALEREALGRWWHSSLPAPRIEINTPLTAKIRTALAAEGRDLYWFDLPTVAGISVITAVSPNASGKQIYLGAAGHTDALKAAEKSALELMQFLFWDTQNRTITKSRARWIRESDLNTQIFLRPTCVSNKCSSRGLNLAELVAALASEGIEPWAIDLSDVATGVNVIRVLLPDHPKPVPFL